MEWDQPIWQIATHNCCVHNEERSLQGRVLTMCLEPEPAAMEAMSAQIARMARLMPPPTLYADLEELICSFPAQKRRLYRRQAVSLLNAPLESKDAIIKSFVKSEKLKILDRDGDPRMIQARNPRFNLVFGMYTKAIEHSLYHLMDPVAEKMGLQIQLVAKGQNLSQRAGNLRRMWDLMTNPVAISLDLSRWDLHVSVDMLKQMHRLYLTIMPDPMLKALLSCQLENRAVTKNGVRYKVRGGVMSGDMTTALGNCTAVIAILLAFREALYACASGHASTMSDDSPTLAEIYRQARGWFDTHPVETTKVVGKLPIMMFDDGDDHVLLVEKEIVPIVVQLLPQWWKSMGHELKVEGTVEQFHQILFCQHKPHLTAQGWVMMPDPNKVLATAFSVTSQYQKQPRNYLATLWTARCLLHRGTPILGPLFERLAVELKDVEKLKGEEFRHTLRGLEMNVSHQKLLQKLPPPIPITPEQRIMAMEQWQVLPDQQRMLEETEVTMPKLRKVPRRKVWKGENLEVTPI